MEKLILGGITIMLFLAAGVMIFLIGDHVLSTEQRQRVTIVERGQTGEVAGSSSATYDLLIEFDNGRREIVKTDEDTFVNIYEDEIITLTCHYGGWTEDLLACEM